MIAVEGMRVAKNGNDVEQFQIAFDVGNSPSKICRTTIRTGVSVNLTTHTKRGEKRIGEFWKVIIVRSVQLFVYYLCCSLLYSISHSSR